MDLKLVIFDMAGTTVQDDHIVEKCFAQAAKETGLEMTDEEILSIQGWKKSYVFETYWERQLESRSEEWETAVKKSYEYFKKVLENYYYEHELEATEGCLDLFRFLRENGVKIALTTGFYREVTDIILNKLGWLDGLDKSYIGTEKATIDFSISSDQVNNGRPSSEMIDKAMMVLGIESSKNVINIGDTPSDLLSGKNAGCLYSFGLTNGTHSREQLEKIDNDGLFENLYQFKEFLHDRLLIGI